MGKVLLGGTRDTAKTFSLTTKGAFNAERITASNIAAPRRVPVPRRPSPEGVSDKDDARLKELEDENAELRKREQVLQKEIAQLREKLRFYEQQPAEIITTVGESIRYRSWLYSQ